MIRPMCEQFVARAAEPFRLDVLWPLVERMERYGIAGFGWGATWLAPDGTLSSHRDTRAFRDDPGRDRVGAVETTSLLVHLRRPSKLSTLQLARHAALRRPRGSVRVLAQRRARRRPGRARALPCQGPDPRSRRQRGRPALARGRLGETVPRSRACSRACTAAFGGVANLAVLAADGTPHHYAGNPENPVFTFRLGGIGLASTAIYSDRSLAVPVRRSRCNAPGRGASPVHDRARRARQPSRNRHGPAAPRERPRLTPERARGAPIGGWEDSGGRHRDRHDAGGPADGGR